MKPNAVEDLDTLIENEKRALIEEYVGDAWSELTEEGIDPSLVAEVFAESALRYLTRERGGEAVSKLIIHLTELDEMGFLPSNRTLQ